MNVEQRQAAADPQTKPPDLGCECYRLQPPSPFIIITQPESWYSFTVPQRVEGCIDLGTTGRVHTACAQDKSTGTALIKQHTSAMAGDVAKLRGWVSEYGLTSPSTHYRSFRRRVFPVNHLHWYWQPNKNNQATERTNNTQTLHTRGLFNNLLSSPINHCQRRFKLPQKQGFGRFLRHAAAARTVTFKCGEVPVAASASQVMTAWRSLYKLNYYYTAR